MSECVGLFPVVQGSLRSGSLAVAAARAARAAGVLTNAGSGVARPLTAVAGIVAAAGSGAGTLAAAAGIGILATARARAGSGATAASRPLVHIVHIVCTAALLVDGSA